MDFQKIIEDVATYATYVMMRDKGSKPEELIFITGHEELEKKYSAGITNDEYSRAIIDAGMAIDQGLLQ